MRDDAPENISFLNSGIGTANLAFAGISSLAREMTAPLTEGAKEPASKGNMHE
ncbi:hypothetical protein JET14_09395 [Martelella lutilitoris]|uniref:Uncharacterized protein n=1 Tax=Martelella lutilitoris TaxID=2583532 RepID=A0A7T7HNL9_9HYPH|nr:hypothetical protein [Martelella lutilitoris]QQM32322.1 hypothetical protein JET14_09395 [Martelella lutilitoris]